MKTVVSIDNRLTLPETCSPQNHLQQETNVVSIIKLENTILALQQPSYRCPLLAGHWSVSKYCRNGCTYLFCKFFSPHLEDSKLHAAQDSVGNRFKIPLPTLEVTVSHNLWLNLAWEPALWWDPWRPMPVPSVLASLVDGSRERGTSFSTEQKQLAKRVQTPIPRVSLEWKCKNHRLCLLALFWSKLKPPWFYLDGLPEKLSVYVGRKQGVFELEWRNT